LLLIAVFASLGDENRALQWLEKAFENRDRFLTEIKTHPYLVPAI
jgi:hypothetical protein